MCIGGSFGKVLNPISALPAPIAKAVDPSTAIRDKAVSSVAGNNQKLAAALDPMKAAVTDPLAKSDGSPKKTALGS